MTWAAFHRRGDVLRAVIAEADARQDGTLPTDVDGVSETFRDDLDLLATLHLRWHTRLSGAIERHLTEEPFDLEAAVIAAWCEVATQMPGVRRILDAAAHRPADAATSAVLDIAIAKERHLLAVMAGRGSLTDTRPSAAGVGARIEERARRALEVAPAA